MKKIRLNINKIKNKYYARIPNYVVDTLDLNNGQDIDVYIYDEQIDNQVEMWNQHIEDIKSIIIDVKNDVHTINMYNRIYIPEKFRFFFPTYKQEFLLITNVGNIKTHITINGYFTKGLRQWFYLNGPLMPGDKIEINIYDEDNYQYEMNYIKNENNN